MKRLLLFLLATPSIGLAMTDTPPTSGLAPTDEMATYTASDTPAMADITPATNETDREEMLQDIEDLVTPPEPMSAQEWRSCKLLYKGMMLQQQTGRKAQRPVMVRISNKLKKQCFRELRDFMRKKHAELRSLTPAESSKGTTVSTYEKPVLTPPSAAGE